MKTIEQLLTNEHFLEQLSLKTTKQEVKQLFEENGVTISDDEYEVISELISIVLDEDKEIPEELLNEVSAGAVYAFECSCGVTRLTEFFAKLHMGYGRFSDFVRCKSGYYTFCVNGRKHTMKKTKIKKYVR